MENTKETKGKEKATPRYNGEQKTFRKLPQVDATAKSETNLNIDEALHGLNSADSFREKDSQENIQDSEAKERNMNGNSSSGGSAAYISETLIMQITKEQRLDLIKSLTIHLPKDKMNKKIKYIENLEKLKRLQSLNLSNNMIEKMQKLESLVELRELNLANNCLKVIECLDNLVKLQVLNLCGNQITSIPGPAMKKLHCLKVLKLSHNKLEMLLDITRLRPLQDLTNLDLQSNPFTSLPHYRQFVIFQLRSLDILDNQTITKEERLMADQRFAQEEVRRLEAEISKQEKLFQNVQNEKNEAQMMVENLTKTQNTLKAKVSKQTDRVEELEQNIEAKSSLLKAKNSDLIKASEKQYRLEQELAFYKLDAKFEMLGQMPLPEDSQMDEEDGLEDSSYIGKATFKRNQFFRESNNSNPERVAHMRSLRMKYEEDEKMRDKLDRELREKKQMIIQLEDRLEQLSQDVEEKNDQLRDNSEKLASLELSLVSQMASFGQGNELAKKQLAEKIEFIKRLQAAAEELEKRMNIVANDVAEKQKELEELRRKAAETGNDNDDDDDDAQSDLRQAVDSKEAELQDAYAQLSKMKEDLEMLKNRIAEEQAQVEMLREQLEKGETMSEKAMNQLKKDLDGVIGGLNERLGELQNLAREQQARIGGLEKERDLLEDELTKRDNMEGNVDLLQRQRDDAERALDDEQEKTRDLEERERDLQGQLSALDKNNNLDLIEAHSKLRHADEENEKKIKKLKDQIENERKAAKHRVERDEERVAKALEAARMTGEKGKEMKGLALQVDALKATNEALNDRLEEAEDELINREKDSVEKDELLQRLNDLLKDVEEGKKEIKQPVDRTDGVGQCLADLHKKYLELAEELEHERQNGKHQQKQAKAVIDTLKAELAQCQSQLNAAEKALAQLSNDGTEHDDDMKSLEDNVYRLQQGLRRALDKAEDEARKRKRDAKAYEEKFQALEDEIGRLQDELNEERELQEANELDHVKSLAEKQKDHLENEIGELQNELRKLKDKYRQDLKRKNENVAELEALLSEKDKLLAEEKNRKANALERELEELRRLVSDQTMATQDSINKEMETKRVHRKLEDSRRKIDAELKTAENKVHRLEQLLDSKDQHIQASRRRGFELDDTIAALTGELETLRRTTTSRRHDFDELPSTVGRINEKKEQDEVPRAKIHRHIYNHNTPVNEGLQTLHQHRIDNTSPLLHQTREHTISLHQVSPSSVVDQVHHHHHYGNGDFTLDLKKKKSRKKDSCNVVEHEDLEDDVMGLEDDLARANSELSSQKTENKLNVLRSDLQVLEQTVSESVQRRTPVKGVESQLDETLARFQDHLLTLMDHRMTLLSQKK